jgi:hypothetical protein
LEEELDTTFFFDDAEAFDSTLAIDFLSAGLLDPTTLVAFFSIGFFSIGFLDGAVFFTTAAFLGAGAGFFATTLGLAAGLEADVFLPRVFFTSFFFSTTGFLASLITFLAYFSSALRSCF